MKSAYHRKPCSNKTSHIHHCRNIAPTAKKSSVQHTPPLSTAFHRKVVKSSGISVTMSVGFGFSVGDFISALELVATVVDALRESGESSSEFRALVAQLQTLRAALESVNSLVLDGQRQGETLALRQAAAQCQKTI